MADFTAITAMKMNEDSNVFIKTKQDTVYPQPQTVTLQQSSFASAGAEAENNICNCRKDKFIQCVIPRDHFFDTRDRARVQKEEKPYRPSTAFASLRGEQPIRKQYGYTINEAKILPSKRLAFTNFPNDS